MCGEYSDKGDGHDGNVPSNVLDGDLATRWSQFGKGRARNIGSKTLLDGFQTHVQLTGWGNGNIFRGNKLTGIPSGGYGINVHSSSQGTVVACDNTVNTRSQLSTVTCR